MGKYDDKYTVESDHDSQVRHIIKQLNEEAPSSEKSREVVTRADGTKMVRVVKKKKVMVSKAEKMRRSRRSFLVFLLVFILLVLGIAAFFSYRMASMTGTAYMQEREAELARAWGAESVHCTGAQIDGLSLKISSIVAEFPPSSMIESVELREISAVLDTSTFFTGLLRSDEAFVKKASIRLRPEAQALDLPRWQGDPLWNFKRISCESLDFSIGQPSESPLSLTGADAYMYFPGAASDTRVVILKGGVMKMRGWKPICLFDAKLQISPNAVEDIRLTGSVDGVPSATEGAKSQLTISGRVSAKESLDTPLMLDTDGMNFAEFSAGRFSQFFAATTLPSALGKEKPVAYIQLPLHTRQPLFKGVFRLKDVRLTSLPALLTLTDHIEPVKRKGYLPPKVALGCVELRWEDETLFLSIKENDLCEPDLISLYGEFSVDKDYALSGTLNYGLPSLLAHVEYPDGGADPIFRDDGVYAWLATQLSGRANAPTDNSAELDAQAEEARRNRPPRTPFSELDINTISERYSNAASSPLPSEINPDKDAAQGLPSHSSQLLDDSSNLQNNSSSSGDRLTLPVDDSIFP